MNKPPAKNMVLIYAALAAVTFAAFEPVRHNEFIKFDDDRYITGNQHVQSGLNRSSVLWAFGFTKIVYWMPLAWLSHILDCQLFGLKSGMHHLTSLLIHIANTLLLFAVFKRMTGRLWPSAFAAALFALHPLNVDSVAWISERKNILSTFFWMLTMLAYVYYTEKPSVSRYLLIITAFVFGLLSKPMLVTLPCVLLLLDYWPLKRFERKRISHLVLEKLPLFVLTALSTYLSSVSFKNPSYVQIPPIELRIANALVSYIKYISKLIWPTDVAIFYPYPSFVPAWQAVGSLLLLVFVSAIVILLIRKKPYLLTGWLWYTGTLVPVLGLVQIGLWPAMADRWMYVPAVGIFIMLAWGADELTVKLPLRKPLLITAGCIIIAAMLVNTHLQVKYWRNSFTLFGHTLQVTKDNYLAHNNIGHAFQTAGNVGEAIKHYETAIKIKPDIALFHYNYGNALKSQGRLDEAISQYEQSLQIRPDYAQAHNNLGGAFHQAGKLDEAAAEFQRAVQLESDYAEAYNNLGIVLLSRRKYDEALTYFDKTLQLDPDFFEAYNNIGIALAGMGKVDEAIESFQQAVKMKPDYGSAQRNLAGAIKLREELKKKKAAP